MTSSRQEVTLEVHSNGSAAKGVSPDLSRQLSTQSEKSTSRSQGFRQTLFSWRTFMVIQVHLSILLIIMISQNMPFALVCMLKTPAHNSSFSGQEVSSALNMTPKFEGNNSSFVESSREGGGEFSWDSSTQGLLLSGVSMLAFVTPLLTDHLSRRVGAKVLVFWTMFLSGTITLLQPLATRASPYLLLALRMIIGFLGGMKFPLINELFSWWAPNSEKVTMISFAYSASNTGTIVVSLTSGYLCSIPLDNGWPFIFYVHGALTVLWCITWYLTGSVKPEDHPYISEAEKQYIIRTRHAMDKNQKRSSPPYRQILTSGPMWGYLIIMTVHVYSIMVLMAFVPIYFNTALGFNIEKVGLISSVTYVLRLLGVLGWGQVSNLLLRKTRLTTTACRKLVQCSGYYLSGAGLMALAFVREEQSATVVMCFVLVMQSCASASGVIVPLDMAPRYSGFLAGFSSTIAAVVAIPGPLLTSYMVRDGTMEEWRNVFIALAVIATIGATSFLVLASSELQSWAKPGDKDNNPQMESSDMKGRRMSILSEGSPCSPPPKQKNFDFSIIIQSPNFSEARLEMNSSDLAVPPSPADNNGSPFIISDSIPMTIINSDEISSSLSSQTATATDCGHTEELSSVVQRKGRSDRTGSHPGHHHSRVQDGKNGAFTNLGFDGKSVAKD